MREFSRSGKGRYSELWWADGRRDGRTDRWIDRGTDGQGHASDESSAARFLLTAAQTEPGRKACAQLIKVTCSHLSGSALVNH